VLLRLGLCIFCSLLLYQVRLEAKTCRFVFVSGLGPLINQIAPDWNPLNQLEVIKFNRKLRQLKKRLDQVDLAEVSSVQELRRLLNEVTQLRWKINSPSSQAEIQEQLIQDAILREGIVRVWLSEFQGIREPSFFKTWQEKISLVFEHPFIQVMMLPWVLPKIRNEQISIELLEKIMLEGLDPFLPELAAIAKKEGRIQSYQKVRAYYTPLVLSIAFALHFYLTKQELEKETEAQFDAILEALMRQSDQLEQELPKLDSKIVESAIAEALKDFERHWGEPPTEEEKSKIAEGIRRPFKR
jgi:hypothetical protein